MWRLSPACLVAEALRLFGLAAGGVCLAVRVTPNAVRSYRTISPLPEEIPFGMSPGGILSVALSVGLLRLDVIKHQTRQGGLTRPSAVRTFLIPINRDAIATSAAMS